jgi:hypothetical protein
MAGSIERQSSQLGLVVIMASKKLLQQKYLLKFIILTLKYLKIRPVLDKFL